MKPTKAVFVLKLILLYTSRLHISLAIFGGEGCILLSIYRARFSSPDVIYGLMDIFGTWTTTNPLKSY